MSGRISKKEFIEALQRPLSGNQLRKVLEALPSMIPYVGAAYASITTANQLEAINGNIETILSELKVDVADNLEKINDIIRQINEYRDPEFILNSEIHRGGGVVEYLLSFTLSNTGGSIIHVRKICLNLSSTRQCEDLHYQSIRARMDEYKYFVGLHPGIKKYLLDDRDFSYKNGDIDKFTIGINACAHMFYYIQVSVEYSDVRSNVWQVVESPIYCLHFNRGSLDSVFGLLKIYKEHPDLLAKKERFQNRPDLIEYFQQNYQRFVEFPEIFMMFKNDPNIFLDIGIDRISESIRDRLRQKCCAKK